MPLPTAPPDLTVGISVSPSNRGDVIKCAYCANATLPAFKRSACAFCFGRGFVVTCLPCGGEGMVGGGNVWGNEHKRGSDYRSPCPTCGGKGIIPATAQEEKTARETQEILAATPATPISTAVSTALPLAPASNPVLPADPFKEVTDGSAASKQAGQAE